MEDITHKIKNILNTYYNNDGSIICDNGRGNVIMVDSCPLQFDFIDTDDYDIEKRSDIEEGKIKFLNEVMEVFFDIQRYSVLHDESLQYSTNIHSGCEMYPCNPDCKCGNWGYQDSTDCMTELDKQILNETVGNGHTDTDDILNKFTGMSIE